MSNYFTIGPKTITVNASGLPANKRVYVYLNEFDMTPLTAVQGVNSYFNQIITTDSLGALNANIYIPNNAYFSIPAGPLKLTIVDNNNWPETESSFIAEKNLEAVADTTTTLLDPDTSFQRPLVSLTNQNSPLSQTFFVDSGVYPQGIYLKGLEIYFRTKSVDQPVVVELRPCNFGIPVSDSYISGTSVVLQPSQVNVPTNVNGGLGSPTRINFDNLVYLKEGQTYAICILSSSSDYSVYSGRINETIVGSTTNSKVNKEPFVGQLFKTNQLRSVKWKWFGLKKKVRISYSWAGDPNQSLCFNLIKAKFEVGSKIFNIQNQEIPSVNFDSILIQSATYKFGDLSDIGFALQTKNLSGTTTGYQPIQILVDTPTYETKKANVVGDVGLQITYNNKSYDTSPIIDLDKTFFSITKYSVDKLSNQDSIRTSELFDTTATANARYLGRQVLFANGVKANGIRVSLDVNRKIYTDIDVFCRIRSSSDKQNMLFDSLPWQRIPLANTSSKTYVGLSDDAYSSEIYENLNITYTNPISNTTFNDFNNYQIKVVFYSENNSVVPRIKNLIASAVYA
jgi:hypothetical protein